ncbi:MAG: guanylate kinase [Burkholderiales bacterium]
MKGLPFVVTAPSGAGKTSLINAVLAEDSRLRLSVSYTTRPPRSAEQNGREYHFVDDASFVAMLERGEFLESAQVHGHRYGTAQATIAGALEGGDDLVLEIDWQGAQQVRRLLPQCVGIFLLPPSLSELELRLRNRGQDSDQVIGRRMAAAREEISHFAESDYVIVNKDFEVAKCDMLAIIRAERLVTERQLARIGGLF